MSQTWDLSLVGPVAGEAVGTTVSAGSAVALAHQSWDLTLITGVVPAGVVGNTLSQGVAGAQGVLHQSWDLTLIDGSVNIAGNTLSQGVAGGVAEHHVWYDVDGPVTGSAVSGAAVGNTLSAGEVVAGTIVPQFIGDTISAGVVGAAAVFPPGAAILGPYWEPGEVVHAYRVWEWKGAIGARLGAGPGPVAATTNARADSSVEFTGLANGHYIAIGAEGQRRYFFVGEP